MFFNTCFFTVLLSNPYFFNIILFNCSSIDHSSVWLSEFLDLFFGRPFAEIWFFDYSFDSILQWCFIGLLLSYYSLRWRLYSCNWGSGDFFRNSPFDSCVFDTQVFFDNAWFFNNSDFFIIFKAFFYSFFFRYFFFWSLLVCSEIHVVKLVIQILCLLLLIKYILMLHKISLFF